MVRMIAIWLVSASVAQAQGPVLLRYQPVGASSVRTVLQARGTIVFREIAAGVPASDSVVGEASRLAGVTRRVLEVQGRESGVEITIDSLRIRSRLLGQSWNETALPAADRGPFTVRMDDRARWSGVTAPALATLRDWQGVEFPEEPVAPGGTWSYPTAYRVPAELGALLQIGLADSLEGTTTVTLDSVVVRAPTDSLIYLRVDRTLGPVSLPAMDAGDSAVIDLAGTQAGMLIWSTAWQSFASGATQTRVRGKLRGATVASSRAADVTWTVSTRVSVRF